MMVLIISKGVGDRFNYSVFHHQIMLKGFMYVGGIPEHVIKRAHLDVSATAPAVAMCCTFTSSATRKAHSNAVRAAAVVECVSRLVHNVLGRLAMCVLRCCPTSKAAEW
jgi:hypothetical protein